MRWLMIIFSLCLFASRISAQTPSEPTLSQLKQELDTLKSEIKILQEKKLVCTEGKSVQGPQNKWSPWSACPEGSAATGLARVDIQGNHEVPTNHVNDFQCSDKGCRAWCIGNPCEVIARCCRL
ncbi:MAG: hypothetical protein H7249_08800 [Chitinophagaceae bacterium]|nr:hypothetical protein [Oligoflexus sp.]